MLTKYIKITQTFDKRSLKLSGLKKPLKEYLNYFTSDFTKQAKEYCFETLTFFVKKKVAIYNLN
jgi:hypothetical protein